MTALWGGTSVEWGYGEVAADATVVLELGDYRIDLAAGGWIVQAVDLGSPVVREVVQLVPQGDGTDDHTEFVGGRNILLSLHFSEGDRQDALDALARFLDPSARPTLRIATETWRSPRSITVRHSDLSMVWDTPVFAELSVGFRSVGSPYFTGDSHTDSAFPAEDMPGRTYPLTFPRVYPDGSGVGLANLDNDGNRPAHWVARIFGPITGPSLVHSHAGVDTAVTFASDFETVAGDYIEIDSAARTVTLNGEAGAPRYSFLDFSETTWWRVRPGANTVRLDSESYDTPAQAEITFYDTYA